MTDKKHETKVKNCLTGKENSINVVVQSSNNRGKTTIPADKCNTGMPIDEIRGEKKYT